MRKPPAQKPGAKAAAEELGDLALESWVFEASAPRRAYRPISGIGNYPLSRLMGHIRGDVPTFQISACESVAALTDVYVCSVGDVFQEAHAYSAHWGAHGHPTTMTPHGLTRFKGVVRNEFFDYANNMATFGVKPHGPSLPTRFRQHAYSSVIDDPVATEWGVFGRLGHWGVDLLFSEI